MIQKTKLIQRLSGSLTLLVSLLIVSNASGITIKSEGYDYYHQYYGDQRTEVGLLNIFTEEGGGFCSGTVIRDQWILTAAHCVDDADFLDFEVGNKDYFADEWYIPNTYLPGDISPSDQPADIALVHVTTPFARDIPRRDYNKTEIDLLADGQDWEMVGYGLTGTALGATHWDGEKRSAWNVAGATFFEEGYWAPAIYGTAFILSDFDVGLGVYELDDWMVTSDGADWKEDGALVLEGGVASGDSGGPDILGGVIIGVHSWGWGFLDGNTDSSSTDMQASTNTVPWAAWLDAVIAGTAFNELEGFPGTPIFGSAEATALAEQNTLALFEFLTINYPELLPLISTVPGDRGYMFGRGPAGIIPEPGTLGLLGLGTLALLRRRRR